MEEIILRIKNKKKQRFLMELINELDFVEIVKERKLTSAQKQLAKDLRIAFNDIVLYEAGKKKLKSAQELLDEL